MKNLQIYHQITKENYLAGILFIAAILFGAVNSSDAQICENSTCTFEVTPFDPVSTAIAVLDVKLPSPAFSLDHKIKSAKLYVKLRVGEDYRFGDLSFNVEVNFDINAYNQPNSGGITLPVFDQVNQLIVVDNTMPEAVFFKDYTKTININDIESFKIDINSTTINNNTLITTPTLNSQIEVEFFVVVEYGIDVRDVSVLQDVAINKVTSCNTNCDKVITFTWDNDLHLFHNYEFQLLRLYNNDPANINDQQDIVTEVNSTAALTIKNQSAATNITITIVK